MTITRLDLERSCQLAWNVLSAWMSTVFASRADRMQTRALCGERVRLSTAGAVALTLQSARRSAIASAVLGAWVQEAEKDRLTLAVTRQQRLHGAHWAVDQLEEQGVMHFTRVVLC